VRSPGGPGSNVDLAVQGAGGLVYPISMPGSGSADGHSPTPSSEKEAPFALEDALEHGAASTYTRCVLSLFFSPRRTDRRRAGLTKLDLL